MALPVQRAGVGAGPFGGGINFTNTVPVSGGNRMGGNALTQQVNAFGAQVVDPALQAVGFDTSQNANATRGIGGLTVSQVGGVITSAVSKVVPGAGVVVGLAEDNGANIGGAVPGQPSAQGGLPSYAAPPTSDDSSPGPPQGTNAVLVLPTKKLLGVAGLLAGGALVLYAVFH